MDSSLNLENSHISFSKDNTNINLKFINNDENLNFHDTEKSNDINRGIDKNNSNNNENAKKINQSENDSNPETKYQLELNENSNPDNKNQHENAANKTNLISTITNLNNLISNENQENLNATPQIRKKKSHGKNEIKTFKEVDVILELYTKILTKKEVDKCICHNNFEDEEFLEINNTICNINKSQNNIMCENPHNNNNNRNIKVTNNSFCTNANNSIFYEREIISSLSFLVYQNDKIKLFDVISKLKSYGYPLTGAMISIYSKLAEDYVFIGADPIDQNFFISTSEYNLKLIKLRVISHIEDKLMPEINPDVLGQEFLPRKNSNLDNNKSKRTKERKIGYIIEKVNSWRKLYNGFYDDNGKFTKYSLDEAAKIIGISKKSLDDYLLQLRLGRKFGFDFNSNKNQKVGILRSYVKQKRTQKNEI